MSDLPIAVKVKEVDPRDGLQAQATVLATEDKLRLIHSLTNTGITEIEASSFVSSKAISSFADVADVFPGLQRSPKVVYSAIVSDEKGVHWAVEADADEIQVFLAATESHNHLNVQMILKQPLRQTAHTTEIVRDAKLPYVAVLSTAFGCTYEGPFSLQKVLDISDGLVELGAEEITPGDTNGMAYPNQVSEMCEPQPRVPLPLHFYNTNGVGLANVPVTLEIRADHFDASVDGLGGSMYAAGATKNIPTEDLLRMLYEMGLETGIDLEGLISWAWPIQELLGDELSRQVMKAGTCSHFTEAS